MDAWLVGAWLVGAWLVGAWFMGAWFMGAWFMSAWLMSARFINLSLIQPRFSIGWVIGRRDMDWRLIDLWMFTPTLVKFGKQAISRVTYRNKLSLVLCAHAHPARS
jgi:hypothetical protein